MSDNLYDYPSFRSLVDRGSAEEDVVRAIILAGTLCSVDALVFPCDPAVPGLVSEPLRAEGGEFLGYGIDTKKRERYFITIQSLAVKIERLRLKNRRGFKRDGKLLCRDLSRLPLPTEYEFIVQMAAHEVRHRMQQRDTRLRLFTPNLSVRDPLTARLIRLLGSARESANLSATEFDAIVVDHLVLHLWRARKGIRRIEPILRMQPGT